MKERVVEKVILRELTSEFSVNASCPLAQEIPEDGIVSCVLLE